MKKEEGMGNLSNSWGEVLGAIFIIHLILYTHIWDRAQR